MSTKGYLPHHVIKAFVFWVLAFCTAAFTIAAILQSWGAIGSIIASRCMWTAFFLSAGSVTFLGINYAFGDLEQLLNGRGDQAPRTDPAFGERLKKAKVGSRNETG